MYWNGGSGEVFILSEADEKTGFAFVAADGLSGEIRRRLVGTTSVALLDPRRPRLYMISFRGGRELLVYDTERREITRTVETVPFTSTLAFDEAADRLLVSLPLRSRVLRFEAETLERAGDLKTVFGVRGLALDPKRNLLLCASLATNELDVIDLETERSLARYTLGPWLREIRIDVEAGVAYVSSRYGLFKVRYTDRLPSDS